MKFSNKTIILILIIIRTGCSQKGKVTTMDNGLVLEDIVVGEGIEAQDFNKVVMNYTGKLEDGSVFDSSMNPGREPFTFTLGVG
ncbi:MAG: FKBP-type peptidyl-prolyl cis-trans isomerase, partial [Candidatus Neomarinimicrobiota bacterium]|nr:FKBP-type peptidyl-prolyl cis-trans isomerase [Candidatus Neomarinimicrobiota bacterium]